MFRVRKTIMLTDDQDDAIRSLVRAYNEGKPKDEQINDSELIRSILSKSIDRFINYKHINKNSEVIIAEPLEIGG